ncbi:hypothetical protein [Shimia thalassica]|uniref:hypothetical protein n=1 Tax=Shimia thalassica TaxID=1715693 RepID=UPI0026E2113D|nr:hypothetical protein [Shimia thalassica]MDO6481918.1 hypothetical protein [Shimia thalassica]
MASFSGFIRKSPPVRLRDFLGARGVLADGDFDWCSDGRGAAFVKSIEALIACLPDAKQDVVKAELELLAELSSDDGMSGVAHVCAGEGIDLEGYEGVEDILLMLAVQFDRVMIDRVQVQASYLRKSGGKQWARFQFPDDGTQWVLDQQSAQDAFLAETVGILKLPAHRKREADWFHPARTDPVSGADIQLTQATIYVEDHAESELAFGETSLERHTRQKVLEVGVVCDPKERIVEICAKGGHKIRDKYLQAFSQHFAPHSTPPVLVPRRNVRLEVLRSAPALATVPADGIERVEVSSLSFRSTDGAFLMAEKRGADETLYQFLKRRFGGASPLQAGG